MRKYLERTDKIIIHSFKENIVVNNSSSTKLSLIRQLSVKSFYPNFHANLTNNLVADAR